MIGARGERLAALAWGLVLLACVTLLAWQWWRGAPLDTRITALLPETTETALIERAERHLDDAFESRLLLLVAGPGAAERVDDLKLELRGSGSLGGFASDDPPRPDETLAPYRYRLLTPAMAEDDTATWRQRGLSRLFTPGVNADLHHDPFGVLDAWLSARFEGPVTWRDGLPSVVHTGRTWYLVSAHLDGSPYDLSLQDPFIEALAGFEDRHPELDILRAGLVFHAAAGARQARREITTIGLGSLLGILLLMGWVFRRPGALAGLLLPVGAGILFALPLTWVAFGTLNLVTLAFGASLIGIAVDYSLHLQCARRLHPERPLAYLWPGLLLGLVSSLVAYLVQLATPLPGLRQMASFATLGLLGAWLTVRLWLPRLSIRPHPATARIAARLDRCRLPARSGRVWAGLGFIGLTALLLIATRLTASDDLRRLNPSPERLVDQQRQVQSLLERPGGQQYLVVTADNEARLLARLERLDERLAHLRDQGHLTTFQHLGQAVPAPATQDDNLMRIRRAYRDALPGLLQAAGLPADLADALRAPLASVPRLTPSAWIAMPAGEPDAHLWLNDATPMAGLVLLGGIDEVAAHTLSDLAATSNNLLYRDRITTLSERLTQLRRQISLWLGVALLGLGIIFGWRYRHRAWRVLLPPVGAVVITLGVFAALGIGLTLFHLLGLLLVLGIGLDAGIFSTEHPEDPAAWLAISLSCASSLLAFGLLAFSATPALHFLGITCLIGLLATWALVPFARGRRHTFIPYEEYISHGKI